MTSGSSRSAPIYAHGAPICGGNGGIYGCDDAIYGGNDGIGGHLLVSRERSADALAAIPRLLASADRARC
eukprot:2337782-Rhodomonas_salina.7